MQIDPTDVSLGLAIAGKPALLRHLAGHAASRGAGEAADLLDRLTAREALGSTGIGRGIALPHARRPGGKPFIAFCRLRRPIPFDAVDGAPVDLVLLLLSGGDDAAHLATLAEAARRLRDPVIASQLRRAGSPGDVMRLFGP